MTDDGRASDSRKSHYSEIPNMVDELGLSPHAYRLYGHIRKVAGESGECFQKTDTLKDACGMSAGKVSEAKQELLKHNLITIDGVSRAGGINHNIKVVDIWARNNRWQELSQYERSSYRELMATASPHNHNKALGKVESLQNANAPQERSQYEEERSYYEEERSQYETKNNPIKNNPIRTSSLPSPTAPQKQRRPQEEEAEALPAEWAGAYDELETMSIFNGHRRPIIDRARFELALSPAQFLAWARSEWDKCNHHGGRLQHRLRKENPPRQAPSRRPHTQVNDATGEIEEWNTQGYWVGTGVYQHEHASRR